MLTQIERKMLGAIIGMTDSDGWVRNVMLKEIATKMGYATVGGVLTLGLKTLEMRNHIIVHRNANNRGQDIKVLL